MGKFIKMTTRSLLMLAMVLAALLLFGRPRFAHAAATGSGTAGDPYLVDSWTDLRAKVTAGGYIKLNGDILTPQGLTGTDEAQLVVDPDKTVNLDLNGHVIDRGLNAASMESPGKVILVKGTLNLTDSSPDKTHDGRFKYTPLGASTEVEVKGGIITGGAENYKGSGGVYVFEGSFNMYGGSIFNNHSATSASGVGVSEDGNFNMYDGSIIGNVFDGVSPGGGVHNSGTFCMYGGTIEANKGKTTGGGVRNYGTFNMYGGTIKGNSTENEDGTGGYSGGGGVYNAGTFCMYGGSIEGNKAYKNGGGVFIKLEGNKNTSFSMYGGTIKGNCTKESDGAGGGVYNQTEFRLFAGVIENNISSKGGGIYSQKKADILGGVIDSNTAYDGANIYHYNNSANTSPTWRSGIIIGTQDSSAMRGDVKVKDVKDVLGISSYKDLPEDYKVPTGAYIYSPKKELTGGSGTDSYFQLAEDIVLSEPLIIKGNIWLDLNGHILKGPAGQETVRLVNANLMITDSRPGATHTPDITYLDPLSGRSVPVTGGIITHAEGAYGRGITSNSSNLIMYGGAVCGNKDSKGSGAAGVCFNDPGTIGVCGNVQIIGNKAIEGNASSDSNLYLPQYNGKQTIGIKGYLSPSSRIGVTLEKPPTGLNVNVTFTEGLKGNGEISSFTSDNKGYAIFKNGTTDEAELRRLLAVITQPQDLNLKTGAGSGNVLTVKTGSAVDSPLTYRWYSCKDKNKTDSKLVYEKTNSSGDTSSYTVPTERAGTFYYYCNVSTPHNPATLSEDSSVAKVIVTDSTPPTPPTPTQIKVSGIKLNKSSLTMECGRTFALQADVTPKNATNKSLIWASSNPRAAAVSGSGVVTANSGGTAIITASATDGSNTKVTCKIKVKEYKDIKRVCILPSRLILKKGKTKTLRAVILPTRAKNKRVSWKSSDTGIATVSATGKVKAVNKGTAYIKVTTADGKKTKRIKITVK